MAAFQASGRSATLERAVHEGAFDLDPQHDVEIVGELVRLDADEARLHAGDGAVELVGGHIPERVGKGLLERREMHRPEGRAAGDVVLEQAGLGFVRAEARAAHRVEPDEIGGQRGAGIGRVDALFVETVAGLVRRAEDGGRQVAPIVAGGDAHVVAGERHLEGMHRGVEPAPREVVAQGPCDREAEGALLRLGAVADKEVGARRGPGAGLVEDVAQADPEAGEEPAQARRRLARLVDRNHRVVRVIRESDSIRVGAREGDRLLQVGREDREIRPRPRIDPGGLRHRAQGGPLRDEMARDAPVIGEGLPGLGDAPALGGVRRESLGREGFEGPLGGLEGGLGLRGKEEVAGEARQGGDLLAACLGASRRHHGPRVPREAGDRVQDIVDGCDAFAEGVEGIEGHGFRSTCQAVPPVLRWQAEERPGAMGASGGTSRRQRGPAAGQRGWKWQPAGGCSGEGISPAMGRKARRPVPRRGTLSNRARV